MSQPTSASSAGDIATEPARSTPAMAAGSSRTATALLSTPVIPRVGLAVIFAAALAVMIRIPVPGGVSLDDSWMLVLSHALLNKFTVGRDLVFTFGPLGALENSGQLPALFWVQVLWQVVTRAGTLALALHYTRDRPLWYRGLALGGTGVLLCASNTGIPASDTYFFFSVWLAGASLMSAESMDGRNVLAGMLGVSLLAALALVKISAAVGVAATIALVALHHCWQRRYRLGLGLVVGCSLLWLAGWRLSGQPFSAVRDFFVSAQDIIAGYPDAMMGPRTHRGKLFIAAAVAALFGSFILYSAWRKRPDRTVRSLTILTGLLLLLSWRHATGRADVFHISSLFAWTALVALLWFAAPSPPHGTHHPVWDSVWPGFVVIVIAANAAEVSFPANSPGTAIARSLRHNLKQTARLALFPRESFTAWQQQESAARHALELPAVRSVVGDHELDVHGFHQGHAILGGYRYTARPVFQSYAAYTPSLAHLNASWFAARKPSFVLLNIESIDDRLPALDDAPTLALLLSEYRLATRDGGFLLLARATEGALSLRSPQRIALRFGEWFSPPASGNGLLYVQLETELALAGKIARALFPLRPLRLEVRFADEKIESYNLPYRMAATGFLLHPLIRSNDDVVAWLEGRATPRVVALRVFTPTEAWTYRSVGVAIISHPASP